MGSLGSDRKGMSAGADTIEKAIVGECPLVRDGYRHCSQKEKRRGGVMPAVRRSRLDSGYCSVDNGGC
jgi:hypothetical protein